MGWQRGRGSFKIGEKRATNRLREGRKPGKIWEKKLKLDNFFRHGIETRFFSLIKGPHRGDGFGELDPRFF